MRPSIGGDRQLSWPGRNGQNMLGIQEEAEVLSWRQEHLTVTASQILNSNIGSNGPAVQLNKTESLLWPLFVIALKTEVPDHATSLTPATTAISSCRSNCPAMHRSCAWMSRQAG